MPLPFQTFQPFINSLCCPLAVFQLTISSGILLEFPSPATLHFSFQRSPLGSFLYWPTYSCIITSYSSLRNTPPPIFLWDSKYTHFSDFSHWAIVLRSGFSCLRVFLPPVSHGAGFPSKIFVSKLILPKGFFFLIWPSAADDTMVEPCSIDT